MKMRSRERGRIPGSVGVPVTVYVFPIWRRVEEREREREREGGGGVSARYRMADRAHQNS